MGNPVTSFTVSILFSDSRVLLDVKGLLLPLVTVRLSQIVAGCQGKSVPPGHNFGGQRQTVGPLRPPLAGRRVRQGPI